MTNEEKAVGLSLQVRDLCIEKGVTRDNAETASLLVQQAALQMAQWKDEKICEVFNFVRPYLPAHITQEVKKMLNIKH